MYRRILVLPIAFIALIVGTWTISSQSEDRNLYLPIVNNSEKSDTTAPILTNPFGVATSPTTASGSVNTDENNGKLFWILSKSSTAPSVDQIQAGQNHTGSAADDSGEQFVSATGIQHVSAGSLVENTTYYFHFQQQDADHNNSTVVTSSQFTTGNSPPQPNPLPPDESAWQQRGLVIPRGAAGASDHVFEVQGEMVLFNGFWHFYYIAGDGLRVGGTDVANRALHVTRCPVTLDPSNPANWTKYSRNPVFTYYPSGVGISPEEGVFSVTTLVEGNTLHLLVGLMTDPTPPNSELVDIEIAHLTSNDGVTFTNQGTVLASNEPGLAGTDKGEIWPDSLYKVGNTYYLIYSGERLVGYRLFKVEGSALNNWRVNTSAQISNTNVGHAKVIKGVQNNGGYVFLSQWESGIVIKHFALDSPQQIASAPVYKRYSTALLPVKGYVYGEPENGRWLMFSLEGGPNWWDEDMYLYSVGDWTPSGNNTGITTSDNQKCDKQ